MSPSLVYRRLRAPREDRGLLLDPSYADCVSMVRSNRELLKHFDFEVYGRDFQSLRKQAKSDLVRLAKAYTSEYTDVTGNCDSEAPLVVSGHQPSLFHPGVWAKNFFIDRLAKDAGGNAIQVVVDNDALRGPSILCPTGSYEQPTMSSVPFDDHDDDLPFEMQFVKNRDLLATFADRVADRISPFVSNPLVKQLWPDVVEFTRAGTPLGPAIAMARHRIERHWGSRTLEVPLSQICEIDSFQWFALHWIQNAVACRAIYNSRLNEYRQVHRIRNHAQPLPDLAQRDEWTEVPFWVWTAESPTRSAAWVRRTSDGVEISNLSGKSWKLDGQPTAGGTSSAVEQLKEHSSLGLHLRPRALSNTIFLRLFLSDVFTHGIGGAKYDQVTDLITYDLFGVTPPRFAVLSLTALLPSPLPLVGHREIIHKRSQIREMKFHPERFLDPKLLARDQVSCKVESKIKLVAEKPPRGEAAVWHQRVAAANAELRDYLQEKTAKEEKTLSRLLERERTSSVFASREWSFCLFDEEFLRERLLDLSYTGS